jgi:hypothetical protein
MHHPISKQRFLRGVVIICWQRTWNEAWVLLIGLAEEANGRGAVSKQLLLICTCTCFMVKKRKKNLCLLTETEGVECNTPLNQGDYSPANKINHNTQILISHDKSFLFIATNHVWLKLICSL